MARQRLKLQKIDEKTNDIIDLFTKYLFSVGVRTSKERAWEIFKHAHKLPYVYLAETNKENGIEYVGQGRHISSKHGEQLMVIRDIGRFELKAVSDKKDKSKRATIKFIPSRDMKDMVRNIKVREDNMNERE